MLNCRRKKKPYFFSSSFRPVCVVEETPEWLRPLMMHLTTTRVHRWGGCTEQGGEDDIKKRGSEIILLLCNILFLVDTKLLIAF
jgi:hypothetical protein